MTPLTFWLNAFALWKIKPNGVHVCVSACLCAAMCVSRSSRQGESRLFESKREQSY